MCELGGRGGAWHGMAVMEGVRAVLCIRPRARFKLPSIAASRTYYVPVCLSVPFGAVRERGRILSKGNRSLPSLCFSSSICFLPFLPSHLHLLNSYPSCQCLSHHHHHHHPHISPDPARVTYHQGTTGHDILSFGVPCAPPRPQILLCKTPVHPSASAPLPLQEIERAGIQDYVLSPIIRALCPNRFSRGLVRLSSCLES
ncbi:hypothetical protein LZ31DRAFT_145096 [Colletotrichum somersetense]|nr:hypothetical protein LZ31DRAFT_145096 [Colletotrichum somersetense]